MAEAEVVRIAREYREQLARNEDQALRRMARSWAQMEKELNSSYIALSEDIRALMDSGTAVPKELILTRIRYQQMMAQIEQFLTEYDKTAVQTITYYQKENFNLGLNSASAQLRYSVEEDDIWNKVGRDSAETIAGFAGNGAPLGELLRHDYGDIGNDIADTLITGMGLGKGSLAIADEITNILGEKEYSRAVRIARTEVNRAYRIANADQYRASGVVTKVLRLCYPPTACFACLMMDGEECDGFMVDDHPNGKCTSIAVTIGGHYPDWEHGQDWFLQQDEATQREIMGDARYEMWKNDGIALRDMVTMKDNPVWGGSPSVLSINDIKSRYNVGNAPIISIPKVDTFDRSKIQYSPAGKSLVDSFERENVEYRRVSLFDKQPSEEEIIQRLGGGDMTRGSCASLAYCYAGNKNGMDVLDFRGGNSMDIMSRSENRLMRLGRAEQAVIKEVGSSIRPAKALLKQVQKGKEYILSTGRHAAIVKKNDDDKLQYLELQNVNSGWRDFEYEHTSKWGTYKYTLSDTLRNRFGCGQLSLGYSYLTDISVFKDDEELRDILGYLNTAPDKQKKGSSGYER